MFPRSRAALLRWGAALLFLAIALGAFAAHGLPAIHPGVRLDLIETAARYLAYGGLGVLALGGYLPARPVCADRVGAVIAPAAVLVILGALVFASTLVLLALGGPRWLGAVTPVGGTLMLLGWGSLITRGSGDDHTG